MATGKVFDLQVQGIPELVAHVEAISRALEDAAPDALQQGAEIIMAMQRRLVRVRTGKLQSTIKFELSRGGATRTSVRRSGRLGKTNVIGVISAGDQTTLVGKSKGAFRRGKWQKQGRYWQLAKLIEFGVMTKRGVRRYPFFFPAYRATRTKAKQKIAVVLAGAMRRAKRQSIAQMRAAA